MTSAKVVICSCHGERVFVGGKLIGRLDLKNKTKNKNIFQILFPFHLNLHPVNILNIKAL